MTYATKIDGAWVVVAPGAPFVDAAGISRPGNWLDLASAAERDAAEVYAVPDPAAPPAGKVETARTIGGTTRPKWVVTYADTPPPPEPVVPDGATNSDWRVGLIMWGRFAEIEAKIIEARDSGTPEGLIVWQRWEYANNVYRAELMGFREAFGFSAAEVDESLYRAAAVSTALAARAAA